MSRAFDVVRVLEGLDGTRVTELANHLSLPKSVVYNCLNTLRAERFVMEGEDIYRLSLQLPLMGEYIRHQNIFYHTDKPKIEKLTEKTGEYAHLATEQRGLGVNLYKVSSERVVGSDYQVDKLQRADYSHLSVAGKAILAHLPKERVEWIIGQYELPGKIEAIITACEEPLEELEATRDRGYSPNDGEKVEGLQAIGTSVTNHHGRVLGSTSISGPVCRMKQPKYHEQLIESVINTASVIKVSVSMEESDDDFPTLS